MPLPVTFATLPTGNNPASLLDTQYAAVAAMGTTYCTATGTNTILLSVAPNQPNPTGYVNGQNFSFLAPANNTGPVTIQVGSLAAIPLRAAGAALGAGALIAGTVCDVIVSGGGTTADVVGGSGAASGAYLPLSGGTLTGALTIAPASGGTQLYLNKFASGVGANIWGQTAGSTRWVMTLGTSTAESSGNVGSDFQLSRYDNTGTVIDAPLTITRSTGAVVIKGTSTNDSAAAGFVGEIISSNVTSALTLTTATSANITSITLTAGDWDVTGEVWIAIGTGGATSIQAAINSVSAAMPAGPAINTARIISNITYGGGGTQIFDLRPCRVSVAASTPYYLVTNVVFPSGTTTATGNISARRMR